MRLPLQARDLPGRAAAGAFVLNSGIGKWAGDEQTAEALHGMATGAFPFLSSLPPTRFLRALAAAEIGIGAALLAPVVPTTVAAAALTGFAGSLLTMYVRTPGLHEPGSVRPTQAGVPIAKDVWMLGIGLGFLVDAATNRD